MPTDSFLELAVLSPLGRIGRAALEGMSYLGELVTLLVSASRAAVRGSGDAPAFLTALTRHSASLLTMGVPLVGLVHVGLGSFLSMQAYFGGTFVDGTGAVVGVGLVRNAAPLLTGLTLAGLFAARMTSELRGRARIEGEADPARVADRGTLPAPPPAPDPARLAAVRVGAALVVGPVLATWAVVVGMVVGWQVARALLGVRTNAYFYMFFEMLWVRDVFGLAIKAPAFALFAAAFACHEGLRGPSAGSDPGAVPAAACRAACFAAVAILMLNSVWFLLFYHAGPAFGPTLLSSPGR